MEIPRTVRPMGTMEPAEFPRKTVFADKLPRALSAAICICAGVLVSYARFRPLAQLVEHGTFNAGVAGPSPARPTIFQAPQATA